MSLTGRCCASTAAVWFALGSALGCSADYPGWGLGGDSSVEGPSDASPAQSGDASDAQGLDSGRDAVPFDARGDHASNADANVAETQSADANDAERAAVMDGGPADAGQSPHDATVDGPRESATEAGVTCAFGFFLDGGSCQPANPCDTNHGGCSANAACVFSAGRALCTCEPGYSGDGQTCTSACLVGNGGCDVHAACANAAGGVVCACAPGYVGDGHSCASQCNAGNGGCSANAVCSNGPTGVQCACHPGYVGDGVTCASACATNNGGCSASAICSNAATGVQCACSAGYGGDGVTCTSICAANNGGCTANSTCQNVSGGVSCLCNGGYAHGGAQCLPVHDFYTVATATAPGGQCDDLSAYGDLLGPLMHNQEFNYSLTEPGPTTNPTALPFVFTTYGVDHTQYQVSANGFVRMLTAVQSPHSFAWYPASLPHQFTISYPGDILAPFWVPLSSIDAQQGGTSFDSIVSATIRTAVFGSAPNRRLTIEVGNLPLRPGDAGADTMVTYQVMLFETSNAIEFHYCSGSASPGNEPAMRGSGAVIGIENFDGTLGYLYSNNTDFAATPGTTLHFEMVHDAGPACPAGFVDCDGNLANGCEANILGDPNNCGACRTACPALPLGGVPNAMAPSCVFGACGLQCAPGFGDCNRAVSDGCEINLANNVANCGQCTNRCSDGWSGHCTGTPSTCGP